MNQPNPNETSDASLDPLPRGAVIALCLLTLLQVGWLSWGRAGGSAPDRTSSHTHRAGFSDGPV